MSAPSTPWRIQHADLAHGMPDLNHGATGGMFLVLWQGSTPLGQLVLAPGSLPLDPVAGRQLIAQSVAPAVGYHLFGAPFGGTLPARRAMRVSAPDPEDPGALLACQKPLAALSRLERRLGPGLENTRAADPTVSVVICTRNRPEQLRACLESLSHLNTAPLEVLVVDNDPESALTAAVVEEFARVCYVPEPEPGLSVARNTGLARARGEVVAFTDDDVRVHREWLGALVRVFEDPTVDAATGLILPAELQSPAQVAFQMSGEGWGYTPLVFGPPYFEATRKIGVPVWRVGAGANMAFRRSAFSDVGLFDERLGAGRAGCSEDSELWYRLLAAGKTIRYDPLAVVYHSHRESDVELRNQMRAYMKGHVTALLIQHRNHGHRGNLFRLFVELPGYYARKVVGRLLRGRRETALPLWPQIQGWFMGIAYYVRYRTRSPWNNAPCEVVLP